MLLYYITDRKGFSDESRLVAAISAAAHAGVDYIQLREKDLSTAALEKLATKARAAVAGTPTKLLLNSRTDVAIASGAHGVHLPSGKEQLPASEARVVFAKAGIANPVIGVSCHTREEVEYAESHGADLAVFGPVFEKDGVASSDGIARLRAACDRDPTPSSRMPVLALGGITIANAAACVAAGASGIAAIRWFQDEPEKIAAKVLALRQLTPRTAPRRTRP